MKSKRSNEGYMIIDHRNSPGVTQEMFPNLPKEEIVGPGQVLEAGMICCRHCQRVLMVNPLRTRQRGYCPKCDHYICDLCESVKVQTGECHDIQKVYDNLQEDSARNLNLTEL